MKKLLLLAIIGTTLGLASGCHIGECWEYAWNSRFHPERNARLCQPQCPQCVVTDPCCDSCCSGGTVVTTPGCGCGGAPTVTPGPIPVR
jgi:hypothetical protein